MPRWIDKDRNVGIKKKEKKKRHERWKIYFKHLG